MIACLLAPATFAVGCGGGERQDKNEASGDFDVQIASASFPTRQALSQATKLTIKVKNADSHALPNVAVTVDAFNKTSDQVGLADSQRPVWIVDKGPAGGETAYVNTWALGRLAPGATKTFTWNVTAIQSGTQKVRFRVVPGLAGKAKVASGSADKAKGLITVRISDKPAQARVDPATGKVIRGTGANAEGK